MTEGWTRLRGKIPALLAYPPHKTDRIIQYPSAELRMRCAPVERFDSSLHDLVADMTAVMGDCPGIAVAAPQIGVPLQCFVYELGHVSGVVCNPRIVASSDTLWSYKEGCLSLPDRYWWINRPDTVTVTFQDSNGVERTITEDKLFGRMLQHEIDHLNGKLIVDMLSMSEWKKLTKSLGYVGAR